MRLSEFKMEFLAFLTKLKAFLETPLLPLLGVLLLVAVSLERLLLQLVRVKRALAKVVQRSAKRHDVNPPEVAERTSTQELQENARTPPLEEYE
jgi:hypothetical protein